MDDLTQLSAVVLAKMIREQACSSVEVVQAFLNRIEQVNPVINAIHQVNPDKILAQAKLADKNINKKPLGKLHGVPISLKDAFQVKDFMTCRGSHLFLTNKPAEKNATVVQRLLDAGAIILGITNVPELLAAFETDNLIYGRTNNPYDLSRTPGGSSGGEAALIAANGSPLGIGTDAGGSIRIPAHYTGICGIKPTRGLVPITGGIAGDAAGLIAQVINFGPMSCHVEDLILALDIIAGPNGVDPYTIPIKLADPYQVDLSQLKIGYFTDNELVTPTSETISAVKDTVKILSNKVAAVTEINFLNIKLAYELAWKIFFSDGDEGAMLSALFAGLPKEKISPLLQSHIKRAQLMKLSVTELRLHLIELDRLREQMLFAMQDYDVIICPVAATPALPHGATRAHKYDFSYSIIFNVLNWPSTVIRAGTSNEGLPMGIQIVAKPWCDHLTLAVAYYLQKILGKLPNPLLPTKK